MLKIVLLLSSLAISPRANGGDPPAVVLSGESRATALRLAKARKLLDERKWPESLEALQAILNTAGDDLVSVTPTHFVQVRRLCQVHLASLPPEALRLYRQLSETQARKRLEQARTRREVHLLRKVVDDTFCTRSAEKAIDLLGDLAFVRGCRLVGVPT